MSHSVLVICPMGIERAAVARAIRAQGAVDAPVERSGIGKHAIVSLVERVVTTRRPRLVILAGACGALRSVDDVPPIARIIDEHGQAWTSGFGMVSTGVTLIAVDRIVSTPADKRRLAESSGAAIVDMESHAFAAACERLGIAWAVVRGVSDTPDEMLPERVLRWISPDGRTRVARAALDMTLRPSLIPHVRAVLRRSRSVLPGVGRETVRLATLWAEGR